MSGNLMSGSESLRLSLEMRVNEACDRFEKAWNARQEPRIEEYLANFDEPGQPELLRQLLLLEIELRSVRGDSPGPEDYVERFPEHLELIKAVFAEDQSLHDQGPSAGTSESGTGSFTPSPDSLTEDESASVLLESLPPVPDQIGRYKVRRQLDAGTYGHVYLAMDDLMDRPVAIKVPSSKLLASPRAKDQFLHEARCVARLQHDGIVKAFDFGQQADGTCYIVYEFIEGENLAKRIERMAEEPLPLEDAARMVAQIAEALHYAHSRPHELVHRDIKPANILLNRQGKPRITDFGLAVKEEDLPKERNRRAGTLPYMSPEQVRRESHHLDGRTDIYSLGVIMYELICGQRPFGAKTEDELEDQILRREAKPPRQIKDSVPQELERICLKALSKRVQDRYTTAKDMAEEVLRAAESIKNHQEVQRLELSEIDWRMRSGDEKEMQRLIPMLERGDEPACIRLIFRCLVHSSEAVRHRARQALHNVGWNRVSAAVEELGRTGDPGLIQNVIDGLAAFEAHPQIVELLDRLAVILKGDLRNRTILLLERKRLGLELNKVVDLFKEIHSPYGIEKALGQGLFTASYLARAEGTDLEVVVRVLRPEFVSQPLLRAQFLDLSRKALQLVHENVVLTREVRAFPERNIYFVVRDYVNGVTLQKLLEGRKEFNPRQLMRLLRQLLSALGAIHRREMCHGSLKPSNIFVCEDDRVVLGDPSLPVHGIGVALERLTYDYRYTSPETFHGKEPIGPATDFYSLGCMAYELVYGKAPFVSDNYLELANRHMHEAVVIPSDRGIPFIGPAGDEILLKLLAKSPSKRYDKAEDVLQALERLEGSWLTPFEAPAGSLEAKSRGPGGAEWRSAGPSEEMFDSFKTVQPSGVMKDLQKILARAKDQGRDLFQLTEEEKRQIQDLVAQEEAESAGRKTAPLLHDESLVRFRGVESVVGFDPSGASKVPGPESTITSSPVPSLPAAEPPNQIGDYDILGTLGKGGMGVVYKARDRRLDRVVALKVLPVGLRGQAQRLLAPSARSSEERARFQTEARAVAKLQHPNIMQIYDIGEHEGLSYVVLEYVGGGSLAQKLGTNRPPPREAAELMAKVARAVHHAHLHGVIHRDLKPSNVLLKPDGQPIVADFGLAKMQVPAQEDANVTIVGKVLGTPAYMAPEQAAGKAKEVGPAADIYSLGAMLYELLTGQPPFRAETATETLSQLLTQAPARPRTLNPAVDRDLETICLKCLEKEPARRYASAADLANDLERWLGDEPITASRGKWGWWRSLQRRLAFRRRG